MFHVKHGACARNRALGFKPPFSFETSKENRCLIGEKKNVWRTSERKAPQSLKREYFPHRLAEDQQSGTQRRGVLIEGRTTDTAEQLPSEDFMLSSYPCCRTLDIEEVYCFDVERET